MLAWCY